MSLPDNGVERLDRLDRAGTTASVVCAIHCAISPLILPLLPLALGRAVGSGFEWIFVCLTLMLGVSSLAHSYRAMHGNWRPLALFTLGFTLLLGGRVLEERLAIPDLALVIPAASLMITAHVLNLRLRRSRVSGAICQCPCHGEELP